MSSINIVVRKKDGTIKKAHEHYEYAGRLLQTVGLDDKGFFNEVRFFNGLGNISPYDSGIIVIDFVTKHVLTMQSGFNLYHEVYSLNHGAQPPAGRKVVYKSDNVVMTNCPKVSELKKSGWTIVDYMQDHGIALGLDSLWHDLENLSIEPEAPEQWWEYQKCHYNWAVIPNKKAYTENGIKPFKALTKAEAMYLRKIKKNIVKGKCYKFTLPMLNDKDYRYEERTAQLLESLARKFYVGYLRSGGMLMKQMDYTVTLKV
jgi:hypothetical protein